MKRFLVYVVLTLGLIYFVENIFLKARFFQIFNINELMMSDLAFNDLYYRDFKNSNDSTFMNQEKQVVLINISDIPYIDSNRSIYRSLLDTLLKCEPAAIGVDVAFNNEWEDVFGEFKNNDKIIFGNNNDTHNIQFVNNGLVRFPQINGSEQRSIRYYSNSENSFAAKVVHAAYPNLSTKVGDNETFLIRYNTIAEGIKNQENIDPKFYLYIDSKDILIPDLPASAFIDLFQNKILLIGVLGHRDHLNGKYDVEDRFKVPVDTSNLVNREPVMHGVTIHANAISTILNVEDQFYEIGGWVKFLITIILSILLIYGMMYLKISKLSIRIILIVLSFATIYISLELMYVGIYLQMGGTMFALIVVEEFYDMIEETEHKIPKYVSRFKKLFYSKKDE